MLAPAPLQIRTCGIIASGSSNHGFAASAALIRYSSTLRLHRTARAQCLAVFPSDDSVIRHSASLHWLPRATVRHLPRYYQSAPTSHHPSRFAPFRSLGRYYGLLLVARQRGVAVAGSSSELRRCLNPLPSTHTRGDGGISQVPRQPLCEHALLFDPGGPRASGHYDAPDIAFRSVDGVGSAFSHLSRLNHTACSLAVYASQLGLLRSNTTQDSLPTGGQP